MFNHLKKKIKFILAMAIFGTGISIISNYLFNVGLSTFFSPKPEQNIVLISIDGLRADHLGCYGYDRNISPNLDRFAKESILFENNFSQSPYSISSHISMFTSSYPLSHKVVQDQEKDLSSFNKYETVNEVLGKIGFNTSIFSQGEYFTLNPLYARGFIEISKMEDLSLFFRKVHVWFLQNIGRKKFVFIYSSILNSPYLYQEGAEEVYRDRGFLLEEINKAKETIAKGLGKEDVAGLSDRERSRLLFYGLLKDCDPKDVFHNPLWRMVPKNWQDSDGYSSQINSLMDSYDANIKIIDKYLGRMFSMLKASGAWDESLIIITSGHGQEFFEHKHIGHSFSLYDTHLKTPLLIKLPKSKGIKSGRVDKFSEAVDIMPTILDVFNVDYKGKMQGVSLLPLIKGDYLREKQVVFGFYKDRRSIRTKNYKYITCNKRVCEKSELFNLVADPYEKKNLISSDNPPLRGLDCLIYNHINLSNQRNK